MHINDYEVLISFEHDIPNANLVQAHSIRHSRIGVFLSKLMYHLTLSTVTSNRRKIKGKKKNSNYKKPRKQTDFALEVEYNS